MVINTVINLNGRWKLTSTKDAVISVSSPSITIDLSDFGLPTAFGMILNDRTITVTFPHLKKTVTGKLEQPDTIRWENGNVWKKPINVDVARKLRGFWNSTGEGRPRAQIFVESSSIRIDMSEFGRPTARGSINNDGSITVIFPDDSRTFTAKVGQAGTIKWSDGSIWKQVFVEG